MARSRCAREERVQGNQGHEGWVWSGARRVAGQVAAPAFGAVTARNRERREEREGGGGSFVNKMKFKVLFVNLAFLLFSVLK